jgi:hypothetical protein
VYKKVLNLEKIQKSNRLEYEVKVRSKALEIPKVRISRGRIRGLLDPKVMVIDVCGIASM